MLIFPFLEITENVHVISDILGLFFLDDNLFALLAKDKSCPSKFGEIIEDNFALIIPSTISLLVVDVDVQIGFLNDF